MKKRITTLLSIFALFVLISTAHPQEPIKIVTTIGQITDIVKIIGGDHVDVQGLMGPGVDPHLYKASESDVRKLADAKIIFYNGLYLEAKMENIFKKMSRDKLTVALGETIPKERLLDSISYTGHYDPHIWFNVNLWIKVVEKVRDVLFEQKLYHIEKDLIVQRAYEYTEKLKELDAYVKRRAAEIPSEQRVLVTAHDAFRYFGRAYGFEVVGLQGLSTEAEAGTKDVIELANFITERKIKAMFVESSVPERNIKAVQEAVQARGWDVKIGGELFSDAMGDEGTVEGTYIGMVTHNIDTIVDALKE